MYKLLTTQYESIKGARQALFTYCESIKSEDLFKKIEAFNDNCISDMLVHNINTYISWLENFGLGGAMPFHKNSDVKSLKEIKTLFAQVDTIVKVFLEKYSDDYLTPITRSIPRKELTFILTPLQLFTHVITHEFHHKGQILTMSRLLGYIPADTDVIRT